MIRISLGLLLLGACAGDKPATDGDDTSVVAPDRDGDGRVADEDCDDGDASVYVGAPELCDDKDNDCGSDIDEGAPSVSMWVRH